MAYLAVVQYGAAHMWGYGGGGGWWFPFALLFWIGVAAIAFRVTRFTGGRRPQQPSGIDRARDILNERFARGEMSPDEYEERLSHLS